MLMSINVSGTRANGTPPKAHGNAHPQYASYATKDGMLMIGAWTNRQMGTPFCAVGDPKRAADVESTSRNKLQLKRKIDAAFLKSKLTERTADEWEDILNEAGVPAARVRELNETMGHKQVTSRTVLQGYPGAHRTGIPKALPVAEFTYKQGSPILSCPPPKVGEHTIEIMEELGYDAATISELEKTHNRNQTAYVSV